MNFGFTKSQTSLIVSKLDSAGIDMIEVGHGVGLNASKKGHGLAAEKDEVYMQAAASSIKNSKWGMFAIPGICELENLDACIEYSIGFIRLGVSIESYQKVYPFIERLKESGVIICVNFMKSYAKEPIIFERAAREVTKAGADYIYIVDSAGNMTPSVVRQYCERVEDLSVGFHGHNNLGLAVANALMAMECGVEIIDCSLQGIGRCTGNTMTEHFVALAKRVNRLEHIDLMKILDSGEEHIRPLLRDKGYSTVDIICGYSGFHSSYMKMIQKFSSVYRIDPRQLIIEVCKETQLEISEDLVREKAEDISQTKSDHAASIDFKLGQYHGNEQENL